MRFYHVLFEVVHSWSSLVQLVGSIAVFVIRFQTIQDTYHSIAKSHSIVYTPGIVGDQKALSVYDNRTILTYIHVAEDNLSVGVG